MRKWLYIFAAMTALGLSACKKSSSDKYNNSLVANGVTTNTLGTNCLNTTVTTYNGYCNNVNVNTTTFQRYPVQNGRYYGHQHNYNNGFRKCGYDSVAVYHPSIGLSCISLSYINSLRQQRIQLAYWQWNASAYSFSSHQWINHSYNNWNGGVFGWCNTNGSYGHRLGRGSCFPVSGNWGIWGEYSYEETTTYETNYQYDSYRSDSYDYDSYNSYDY